MTLISYKQLRQDYFIEKAMEYGGMVLIVVLMSLLGFFCIFQWHWHEDTHACLRDLGAPCHRHAGEPDPPPADAGQHEAVSAGMRRSRRHNPLDAADYGAGL